MEDEMTLDGAITAGEFDNTLDVGVVATSEGTLWYINWVERTSVRLVGSHSSKVVMDSNICFSSFTAFDQFYSRHIQENLRELLSDLLSRKDCKMWKPHLTSMDVVLLEYGAFYQLHLLNKSFNSKK